MAGSKEGSMRFTLIVFAICSTLGLSGCTDKSDPTQGGSTSERPIGASNERRECLNSLGPDLSNAELPKSAAAIGAANDFLKRGVGRDLYISDASREPGKRRRNCAPRLASASALPILRSMRSDSQRISALASKLEARRCA